MNRPSSVNKTKDTLLALLSMGALGVMQLAPAQADQTNAVLNKISFADDKAEQRQQKLDAVFENAANFRQEYLAFLNTENNKNRFINFLSTPKTAQDEDDLKNTNKAPPTAAEKDIGEDKYKSGSYAAVVTSKILAEFDRQSPSPKSLDIAPAKIKALLDKGILGSLDALGALSNDDDLKATLNPNEAVAIAHLKPLGDYLSNQATAVLFNFEDAKARKGSIDALLRSDEVMKFTAEFFPQYKAFAKSGKKFDPDKLPMDFMRDYEPPANLDYKTYMDARTSLRTTLAAQTKPMTKADLKTLFETVCAEDKDGKPKKYMDLFPEALAALNDRQKTFSPAATAKQTAGMDNQTTDIQTVQLSGNVKSGQNLGL